MTVFSCLCITITLYAQDDLKKANEAFDEDHFREALIYYNRIDKISTSAPILFKRGVCYYEINQLDNALEDFRRAWEFGYTNEDIDLYTGKILHHKGQFTIAAKHYKDFLKEAEDDDIRRPEAIKLIKQCGRAVDLSYQNPLGIMEQLRGGINTAYDEIGLVESPSVSGKYYFTSNKPNTSSTLHASDYDVYWIQQSEGNWTDPARMSYALNKSDQDILLGFTPEADGIYFYRGKDYQGDIFLSQGVNSKSRPKAVELPSSVSLINNDAYFFNNNVVIYSSREGQGYGGYDLYASVKKDGYWTTPVNLGPRINSPFDEISPYLSEEGSEIYFSSDRDESIGGLDIFYSQYLYEANQWSLPVNMGIPINSPGDDAYFQLSYDGLTATMSSDRKNGNAFGGMDMYIVRFKERRSSPGYGEGQLAFLDYEIPDAPESEQLDGSYELAVSTDTTSVNVDSSITSDSNANKSESITSEPSPVVESRSSQGSSGTSSPDTEPTTLDNTPQTTENTSTVDAETPDVVPTQEPKNKVEAQETNVLQTVALTYEPIYYSSGQDLVTEKNFDNLEQIVSALQDNPDLKVHLVGHSSAEGIIEYKLFSSLKIAERLKRYLMDHNITDSRILIKGVGDNYPMVIQDESNPAISKFTKYNSRVEVYFLRDEIDGDAIERKSPELPNFVQDARYDLYSTLIEKSITYKISIAIVGQMYRNKALDLFNDTSVEEDKTTGLYTYTIGLYDNYAEALKVKRDMDRLGITDASVIAYYDGIRLSEEEYVNYVNDFPDLIGLMNYQE